MDVQLVDFDYRETATTSATFNGVQLSTRIMPAMQANRGGDWCESFVLSKDTIALSIGDVCGHGVEKYATKASLSKAIREAAMRGESPSHVLAHANRFLHGRHPGEYATAIFALLDTRERTLHFANAGHPAPLLSGPCGTMFLELAASDFSLGVEPELVPALRKITLPESTLLIFYTDGVSERDRKPLQGASRLRAAARVAYQYSTRHSAVVIEEEMYLTGPNYDDAAILTAWTPHARWPANDRRSLFR